MLIYLLTASLIITITLVILLSVIIKNLLQKIDTYEEWILDFKEDVNNTYAQMKAIDTSGTFASRLNEEGIFESDDQVGQVFKGLLDLISKLNEKTLEPNDETKKES